MKNLKNLFLCFLVSLFICFLVCLAGCGAGGGGGGGNTPPAVVGSAAGTVTDGRSAVPGVTVGVLGLGLQTVTNGAGSYLFNNNVPVGNQTLTFSKPGYITPPNVPIVVVANQTTNVTTTNLTASRPQVDSITPTHSAVGLLVTINGLGFGTTQGAVTFNGVAAIAITSWSNTQIKVSIPNASTGVVRVISSEVSSTENINFTVDPPPLLPPVINTINPGSGTIGSTVTITGSNFEAIQNTAKVIFNSGVNATAYTSWTDTRIVCSVPANAVTGNVTVTTAAGTSIGVNFTVTGDDPGPWGLSGPTDNYGGNGTGPGQFLNPIGIGIGPDGVRAITDSNNLRVQGINTDGSQAWQTPVPSIPFGVDTDSNNNSIVAIQFPTMQYWKLDSAGNITWQKDWGGVPAGVTIPKVNNSVNHAWLASGNNTVTEIDANGDVYNGHQWNIFGLSSITSVTLNLAANVGWAMDNSGNVAQFNPIDDTSNIWGDVSAQNGCRSVVKIPGKDLLIFVTGLEKKLKGYRTNGSLLWEINWNGTNGQPNDYPSCVGYDPTTSNIHITANDGGKIYIYQIVHL